MAPRRQMLTPELLPEMQIPLQQYPRTRPFEPLHDLADLLRRSVAQKAMNVVSCDLARDNLQLMFRGDLPNKVAHTKCDLPDQHLFAVFWDSYEMYLQAAVLVGSPAVVSHSTTLNDPLLSLKARASHHPRRGH